MLVYRTLRTVAIVMMLIACAASVGYHDGADANAGEDHGFLPDIVERQIRDPDDDQRHVAGARVPHRHGAVDPDHHPDPLAGGDEIRRRSGSLRHDHAIEPRHRPLSPAGRRDPLRRLRRRPRADGRRDEGDLAVLRRDVPRADGGDLYPGDLTLAAACAEAVTSAGAADPPVPAPHPNP